MAKIEPDIPLHDTEVWFRNPHSYIRELVETRTPNIIWDRGSLYLKKIDPIKHADAYYPTDIDWNILVTGDKEQGCVRVRRGGSLERPDAVYPVWDYGDPFEVLEELCQRPPGEDREICEDTSTPLSARPVWGQESRVIIQRFPPLTGGVGRKFMSQLAELQKDYPDAIIHIHGAFSYRISFGLGFRSADIEPRTQASKGSITIPPGRDMVWEKAVAAQQWIHLLGFRLPDLAEPRNRCMYNIESAKWAAKNWNSQIKFSTRFKTSGILNPGPGAPTVMGVPESALKTYSRSYAVREGDKFQCDVCSLQTTCKYFRSGAVCSLPDAEPVELATFFKTRDSDRIIDGLGTLIAINTRRLERGLNDEEMLGELDPEVSKIIKQISDQGVKLAKLVNPALGTPRVGVYVGPGGTASVAATNPKQLVAAIISELEARGIQRQDITPKMIEQLLSEKVEPQPVRAQVAAQVDHQVIEHEEASV